jgi:hypothetical protein
MVGLVVSYVIAFAFVCFVPSCLFVVSYVTSVTRVVPARGARPSAYGTTMARPTMSPRASAW